MNPFLTGTGKVYIMMLIIGLVASNTRFVYAQEQELCDDDNQIKFQSWTESLQNQLPICRECNDINALLDLEYSSFNNSTCETADDCAIIATTINQRAGCYASVSNDKVNTIMDWVLHYNEQYPEDSPMLEQIRSKCGYNETLRCQGPLLPVCNNGICGQVLSPDAADDGFEPEPEPEETGLWAAIKKWWDRNFY